VGLAAYWIFQGLIKKPLIEVLPEGAYARWRPFASAANPRSVKQWLLAACGLLAGATTHLVWDGFTHEGARGVRMFPMLDDPILEVGKRHIDAVRLLQDLGSLIGLIVVAALILYGLRRGREEPVAHRAVAAAERRWWVLAYVVAGVGLTIAFYLWARLGQPLSHSAALRAYSIAVAVIRGLAAALLGVSLLVGLRLRALRHRSSGPER